MAQVQHPSPARPFTPNGALPPGSPPWSSGRKAQGPAGSDVVLGMSSGSRCLAQEILTPRAQRMQMSTFLNAHADKPTESPSTSQLYVNTSYRGLPGRLASAGSASTAASPRHSGAGITPRSSWGHVGEHGALSPDSPLSPLSPFGRASVNSNGTPRPRFDMLTLRQWFNTMDGDHSGCISKSEWYEFLRTNPKLKYFILHGNAQMPPPGFRDTTTEEALEYKKTETRETRRLIKIWKEIDGDGSGTLEWGEFVEFFRRNGNLLEYETQNDPKARLTNILVEMHDKPGTVNEATLEEFEQLTKNNLHGERRRSLELQALTQCIPESATALRIHRRHSCSAVLEPLS